MGKTAITLMLLICIVCPNEGLASENEGFFYFYNPQAPCVRLYLSERECLNDESLSSYVFNRFQIPQKDVVFCESCAKVRIADMTFYCNSSLLSATDPAYNFRGLSKSIPQKEKMYVVRDNRLTQEEKEIGRYSAFLIMGWLDGYFYIEIDHTQGLSDAGLIGCLELLDTPMPGMVSFEEAEQIAKEAVTQKYDVPAIDTYKVQVCLVCFPYDPENCLYQCEFFPEDSTKDVYYVHIDSQDMSIEWVDYAERILG